jgi:hypothetical protein
MPAYSPSLRVELITSGDQAGQWGNTTNSNFQYIFDSAIAGYVPITVGNPIPANYVLTYSNGPVADENLNQSIAAMLQLNSAAAAFNVFAPPVSKQYIIWNNSGYAATIYNSTAIGNTTAAGTGIAIANGEKAIVFSDGTNFYSVDPRVLSSVANGVLYTNASKVVTNGTALTFDGTNLGVGTPTATSKLDVVGANVIVKSNASSGFGSFYALGATGGTAHYFFGINNVETARISSDAGNSLLFSTGVAAAPRMIVAGSGNVGIGTLAPAKKLQVADTDNQLSLTNGTNELILRAGSTEAAIYTAQAIPLNFYNNNQERLRIATDGNIVVGINAPTAAGGGRSIDIYNTEATNNNSLSVVRLITSSVAGGGGTFGADIYKTKGGAFVLNNNETDSAAYTSFGVGTKERMRIDANGNIQVGSSVAAATAPGGGREFDIDNFESTDNNSYVVARLITKNRANSGTANFDIYKAKGGAVLLHNTETDSAAYIDFVIGGSTKATITSGGNLAVTGAITSAGVPVVTTTGTQTLTNKTLSSNTEGTTQSNGDNSTKLATTAYVQNMGLGWGQTWQNLVGSRGFNSTYTNSTGKPIMVAVVCVSAGGGFDPTVVVQGVNVGRFGAATNNGSYSWASFIVPPGHDYSINASSASLASWTELR